MLTRQGDLPAGVGEEQGEGSPSRDHAAPDHGNCASANKNIPSLIEACRARLRALVTPEPDDAAPTRAMADDEDMPLADLLTPTTTERGMRRLVTLPPPARCAEWAPYIAAAVDESLKATHVFKRQHKLAAFLQTHAPTLKAPVMRIRGVQSWQKTFAGRVLAHRLRRCLLQLPLASTREAEQDMLAAVADGIRGLCAEYRPVVEACFDANRRRARQMVARKFDDGDLPWVREAFTQFPCLTESILELTLQRRDTDLMCQILPCMQPGLMNYVIASSVFDDLVTERVVAVVRECGMRVDWRDALRNHRRRETRRAADPTVPPLHPSFYDMLFDMSGEGPGGGIFDHHQDVMTALDVLVEMHEDGRVSRQRLDQARDRIFARAASREVYPSYKYLLESSQRLMTNSFAAAVLPFAMAMAGGGSRPPGDGHMDA
eukprot:jgi/Tetstr1/454193/TSEL_041112.t1